MNELLLMCLIAGRRAAIPAAEVQSVIEIDDITPIPGVPPYIRGLTALRSQALTVIDCRVALGFESSTEISGQRAAVVDVEGHLYALLVDEAYDVGDARSEPIDVPDSRSFAAEKITTAKNAEMSQIAFTTPPSGSRGFALPRRSRRRLPKESPSYSSCPDVGGF